MGVIIENFPDITDKTKIDYEEFISILSKKSNLNKFYKTKIEGKGIEVVNENHEKEIMELDSVKGLYNLI